MSGHLIQALPHRPGGKLVRVILEPGDALYVVPGPDIVGLEQLPAAANSVVETDTGTYNLTPERMQTLLTPIMECGLPQRVTFLLLHGKTKTGESWHMTYVIDIAARSKEELLSIEGFGQNSLRKVKKMLSTFGLCLKGGATPGSSPTVEELGLTLRTENVLKANNILYVSQLMTKTESDLLQIGIGRKGLEKLQDRLTLRGFSLREE